MALEGQCEKKYSGIWYLIKRKIFVCSLPLRLPWLTLVWSSLSSSFGFNAFWPKQLVDREKLVTKTTMLREKTIDNTKKGRFGWYSKEKKKKRREKKVKSGSFGLKYKIRSFSRVIKSDQFAVKLKYKQRFTAKHSKLNLEIKNWIETDQVKLLPHIPP